jgi:Na+-transporting NADH:ubiquinone oxidoreductase subunit D
MSEVAKIEKNESLFSKKNRALLVDPLNDNNPITVQILGICSALAVTSTVMNSLVMGIGVTVVTAMSNLVISAMRDYIPNRIRMIVQLVIVAWLVQLVAMFLQAYLYTTYTELATFIGLIITNCIVMGRLEAYAMANKPWPSFLDGIGNGLGYTMILLTIGTIREIFGSGKLLGFEVVPQAVYDFGYTNNGLMVLPISSIILIGIIIWIQRGFNKKLVDVS